MKTNLKHLYKDIEHLLPQYIIITLYINYKAVSEFWIEYKDQEHFLVRLQKWMSFEIDDYKRL